jgi:hypothetical protein
MCGAARIRRAAASSAGGRSSESLSSLWQQDRQQDSRGRTPRQAGSPGNIAGVMGLDARLQRRGGRGARRRHRDGWGGGGGARSGLLPALCLPSAVWREGKGIRATATAELQFRCQHPDCTRPPSAHAPPAGPSAGRPAIYSGSVLLPVLLGLQAAGAGARAHGAGACYSETASSRWKRMRRRPITLPPI